MKIERQFNTKRAQYVEVMATAHARYDHLELAFWARAADDGTHLLAQMTRDEALQLAQTLLTEALRMKT